MTQVKFISHVSSMGKDVKVVRIPKEDLERVTKAIGKKRVLVTLDDAVFDAM